jgi:hypothetical protein
MAETFRILITGSRAWADAEAIRFELAGLALLHRGSVVVVHGACKSGADQIADTEARGLGLRAEPHPAIWRPGGKFDVAAGFKRNAEMVSLGADLCLAFLMPCADPKCRRPGTHGSHGASHTEYAPESEHAAAYALLTKALDL